MFYLFGLQVFKLILETFCWMFLTSTGITLFLGIFPNGLEISRDKVSIFILIGLSVIPSYSLICSLRS